MRMHDLILVGYLVVRNVELHAELNMFSLCIIGLLWQMMLLNKLVVAMFQC